MKHHDARDVLLPHARFVAPGIDALPPAGHALDPISDAYETAFRDATRLGASLYPPMSAMLHASHDRRMQLLDQLPIGSTQGTVCLDYGVGSWGFAAVFPRLHDCELAIGLDISVSALRESARVTRTAQPSLGDAWAYVLSERGRIDVADSSIDIVFAGECIEHVENTDSFLEEVHRVLKPGGAFVLTTPNADYYAARIQGDEYQVGPEHVSLMGYGALCDELQARFETVSAKGFNHSLIEVLDERVDDPIFARAWASALEDDPDLAGGVVLLLRPRSTHSSVTYTDQYYTHVDHRWSFEGSWKEISLHRSVSGRASSGRPSDVARLPFHGENLVLNLWCHSGGGYVSIRVDGRVEILDLYSRVGGFRRWHSKYLADAAHELEIQPLGSADPRSSGTSVIVYQAITYSRAQRQGQRR